MGEQVEGRRSKVEGRFGVALSTVLVGCGPGGDFEALHAVQSVHGVDIACSTKLRDGGDRWFANVSTRVRHYVCLPEAPDDVPEVHVVDVERGEFAAPQAVAADDSLAFREIEASLDRALRKEVDGRSASDRVPVQVWFSVARPEEAELTAGADVLGADEVASELLEARIREGALGLLRRIAALPEVEAPTVEAVSAKARLGAPMLEVICPVGLLERLGRLEGVTWVGKRDVLAPPAAETYHQATYANVLDGAGYDGTGRTVAILEAGRPDSWQNLTGQPEGSCTDAFGAGRLCHCPAGGAGSHPRIVEGVVRNKKGAAGSGSTSFGGVAKSATTIAANIGKDANGNGPNCQFFGVTNFASAINWAILSGASVINWSEGSGHASVNDSLWSADLFLDYLASVSPYPFFAVITHNGGFGFPSSTWLRNGMVVGGSDDKGTPARSDDDMYASTQPMNPGGGSNGWELPHIVAPAVGISTAGFQVNTAQSGSGTSLAAPQIAALVADLQELNPSLVSYPSAVFAGLMVGANDSVDDAQGGRWPLNLSDLYDDYDGAGLVNAYATYFALEPAAKRNGGNSAAYAGHDYGTISVSGTPNGSYYSEVYAAKVDPGNTLRAVFHVQSRPNCSTTDEASCASPAYPYPDFQLYLFDGNTVVPTSSVSTANNYQFAYVKNTTAVTKTYMVKLFAYNWNGIASARWGLAWLQGTGG